MQMFRVNLKLLPANEHPGYWEHQCCVAALWLFARNKDDAAERAAEIIAQLPYELDRKCPGHVLDCPDSRFERFEANARFAGLSFHALFIPLENAQSDEAGLNTAWLAKADCFGRLWDLLTKGK